MSVKKIQIEFLSKWTTFLKCQQIMVYKVTMASGESTVVEHSSHHPKVESLIPVAAAADTGR
jgi:hypothetical protein